MSESIEYIKAAADIRKQESQRKRQSNIVSSTKMLQQNGIEFESKNGGIHLIAKGAGRIADFWPSTGKFIVRGDKRAFRGVKLLIKVLRGDYNDKQYKALWGCCDE